MNLEDYGCWIYLETKIYTKLHPIDEPLLLEDLKGYTLEIKYNSNTFLKVILNNDNYVSCYFSVPPATVFGFNTIHTIIALPTNKNILPILYYAYLDEIAKTFPTKPNKEIISYVSSLLKTFS